MKIDINQKKALLLLLLAEYDRQQSKIKDYKKVSFNHWLFTNDVINLDEYQRLESKPIKFQKVFELYPEMAEIKKSFTGVANWDYVNNEQTGFYIENIIKNVINEKNLDLLDDRSKIEIEGSVYQIVYSSDNYGVDIDIINTTKSKNKVIYRLFYDNTEKHLIVRLGHIDGLYFLLLIDNYINEIKASYPSDDLPPM